MIIAHNPGIQEICTMLAGKGNLEILQYIKNDYPTCALTEFSFNIEKWNKIEPRGGTLENFILPKEL